jgi:hypothetical protein
MIPDGVVINGFATRKKLCNYEVDYIKIITLFTYYLMIIQMVIYYIVVAMIAAFRKKDRMRLI